MKKLLCFILFTASVLGQNGQPYTITGTGCASISVDEKATVAFYVSGSWSGTIQPSASFAGQSSANYQVTPAASTTSQSTVTTNGAYFTNVAGNTVFYLCGNTVTGTAKIYANTSPYVH